MELYGRERYLSEMRGFYHSNDLIKVISGIRGAGKTSLLHLIANELSWEGVEDSNILYFDFEGEGYSDIRTPDTLDQLLDNTSSIPGDRYLLLDEIHHIHGFEEVINSFRAEGEYSIFITSSNGCLLEREITTILTGRYLEFRIGTLSLVEYIAFKRYRNLPVSEDMETEDREYQQYGCLPEVIDLETADERKTYIRKILENNYRTAMKPFLKSKEREGFTKLWSLLCTHPDTALSRKEIASLLYEDSGIKLTESKTYRYLEIMVNSGILMESRTDSRKTYVIAHPSFALYSVLEHMA